MGGEVGEGGGEVVGVALDGLDDVETVEGEGGHRNGRVDRTTSVFDKTYDDH